MIVDCMTCPVRVQGCEDCAITVLLGRPGVPRPGQRADLVAAGSEMSEVSEVSVDLPLDAAETRVVSMFVGAGLVRAAAADGLRARVRCVQSRESVSNVG